MIRLALIGCCLAIVHAVHAASLPKVTVSPDGRGFVDAKGTPFRPFGVTYFRPGTGWAPQVWKQFDANATRADFLKLKQMGGNCARVFLTYGSFHTQPGVLNPEALERFDRFLALAEEAGIYAHPTGPDHWEGLPEWAKGDRIADEEILKSTEAFWRSFAKRYRGRAVIFAYDLLNEPEVGWDTPALRSKWAAWVRKKYGTDTQKALQAWGKAAPDAAIPIPITPPDRKTPPGVELADYQRFREDIAEDWTRRQAVAIHEADPGALVTAGLIQWSVPIYIGSSAQYSGFRPERLAPLLDFMEIHFYPLATGFYEYRGADDEEKNLAYLECLAREAGRFKKPLVIAEFGWYGGGKPTIDNGRHPLIPEEQQARWNRRAVETSAPWACGWLNWSFHDHPQAGDVTEFIGLLGADGHEKASGRDFQKLAGELGEITGRSMAQEGRPALDWDRAIIDPAVRSGFIESYLKAWRAAHH